MAVTQVIAWRVGCGHEDCDAAVRVDAGPGSDEAGAREVARIRGWDADDEAGRDRCPKHRGDPAEPEPEQPATAGADA